MRIAAAVVATLALWAAGCSALPYTTQIYKQQATSPGAFIGEGINNIAAAFLQEEPDKRQCNSAFSPLGYSAILAALAEGASGKTRSQMLSALKLPQDSSLTRATYRSVLSRMKEKNAVSKPEFRSWFYVYLKNIKIEDSYTMVLRDHYLMEVRDIQAVEQDTPTEFFVNKDEKPTPAAPMEMPAVPAAAPEAPTAAAPEMPAAPAVEEMKEPAPAQAAPAPMPQAEMPAEEEKKEEVAEAVPAPAAPVLMEEHPKPVQDAVEPLVQPAEDMAKAEQIPEAPVVVAEPEMPGVAASEAPEAPVAHQQDTAKVGEAAIAQEGEDAMAEESVAQRGENKATLLAKYGKDEKKPTSDKKKDDKKKGREVSDDSNDRQPESTPSLLTTFNALYYRGVWQVPFDAKFKDDFYVSEGVQKEVTTLRTHGSFRIGDIKELNATAIELPYKGENGRYSLLILLPKAKDGLNKLTEALSKYSFRYLSKNMREKQVDVAIPEFEIDCITHPETVFRKLGMTSMMDKGSAEFPGVSKNKRVYLQDDAMAQLVRFKVDDKTAVANYLTAMSMSTRSGFNVFHANHPFVFYLRDNLDNLTIVVGKVQDPTERPDNSALDADAAQSESEDESPAEAENQEQDAR